MASLAVAGYAFSIAAFATLPNSASAQSLQSSCNAATGLGANGQPCVQLTPLDPNRISNVSLGATGGEQYGTLDTSTLGQTFDCRELDAQNPASGTGVILYENCGTPFTNAELGEFKTFYGTTGAPAPAPAPVPAAPTPVVYSPPPAAPAVVAAAPPAFAPVAVAPTGLGGAGLIAAGVGAAALVGIAAIAIADDDDDSAPSTPSTPGT